MKKYWLIVLILFGVKMSDGQTITFNKRMAFGQNAAVLTGLEVTDSCYYATGIVADQPTTVSNLFVKFDTLGNEIFHKIIPSTTSNNGTWVPS